MDSRPIGFMDSGVGGLTVVKTVIKQLPNEDIVYFGDEARLPYGEKTPEQIQTFASEIARFLVKKRIKLLVVACNTATSLALPLLKKILPIPVIGVIEPGSQLAIQNTKNNHIGVIATNGTVKSHSYEQTLHKLNQQVSVKSIGCPRFVPLVESGKYQSNKVQSDVDVDLNDFNTSGIDTLILGCTHYPIMKKLIQKAVGDDVTLIDPADGVSEQVKTLLNQTDLNNTAHQQLSYQFYTTGNKTSFEKIAEDWLRIPVNVDQISLEELKKYD